MKKFVAHIWMITAMLTLSIGVSLAQNDDETFTIPFVNNGDRLSAQLNDEYDSQIYAFLASGGDRVTLHMAQDPATSPLDPLLIVYDTTGAIIAVDDDGGDNPYFSALIRNLEINDDGIYYILATHKDGLRRSLAEVIATADLQAGLNYTLSIDGNNTPINFDLEAASLQPDDLPNNQTINLASHQALGLFPFAGQGRTFTFETSNIDDGNIDTILLLFDGEGRRIAVNDDAPDLGLLSRIEAELEADAGYLLLVTAYQYERTAEASFLWNSAGEVRLSVNSR
jgi:hypothetical protein